MRASPVVSSLIRSGAPTPAVPRAPDRGHPAPPAPGPGTPIDRAGRALSPCLALAEGRRFISDQSRRKDLADRPPPGECAGVRGPRATEDRAGPEGRAPPPERLARGPSRGRAGPARPRWQRRSGGSQRPAGMEMGGGARGSAPGRQGGYESCAPAPPEKWASRLGHDLYKISLKRCCCCQCCFHHHHHY